jgi:hypothetical protein
MADFYLYFSEGGKEDAHSVVLGPFTGVQIHYNWLMVQMAVDDTEMFHEIAAFDNGVVRLIADRVNGKLVRRESDCGEFNWDGCEYYCKCQISMLPPYVGSPTPLEL